MRTSHRKRAVVSIWIATSLVIVLTSGAFAFFIGYQSMNIFIHVSFGWLFTVGILLHFSKNLSSLKKYVKLKVSWVVILMALFLAVSIVTSTKPMTFLHQVFEEHRSGLPNEVSNWSYIYELDSGGNLELEVKAGLHFFYPQFALWVADSSGNYLETILTTYSTATGSFYGGRTKENFKTLDKNEGGDRVVLRVDALPYWSHQRNVQYADGLFTPSKEEPLVDAISGATPVGDFKVRKQFISNKKFKVYLEVNVAFDDNEYYSEYDFAEDSVYHSGAGLLGQPSLVYEALIDPTDGNKYYFMHLIGHGHHSGANGSLNRKLSTITTAKEILDRIILKYE